MECMHAISDRTNHFTIVFIIGSSPPIAVSGSEFLISFQNFLSFHFVSCTHYSLIRRLSHPLSFPSMYFGGVMERWIGGLG